MASWLSLNPFASRRSCAGSIERSETCKSALFCAQHSITYLLFLQAKQVVVDSGLSKKQAKMTLKSTSSDISTAHAVSINKEAILSSDRQQQPSWMEGKRDVSNLMKAKDTEVMFPSSLDGNSPASLAAAASAIASAASEVADQSQNLQSESNSFNHYVVFKPALQSKLPQDSKDNVGLERKYGSPEVSSDSDSKHGKLTSIQHQLTTLESVVMKLVQAIKPSSGDGRSTPSIAGREGALGGLDHSSLSRPAKVRQVSLQEGSGGATDEDSLEAMQARYRAEGSQNPEADAAIEKVLHELNKGQDPKSST